MCIVVIIHGNVLFVCLFVLWYLCPNYLGWENEVGYSWLYCFLWNTSWLYCLRLMEPWGWWMGEADSKMFALS